MATYLTFLSVEAAYKFPYFFDNLSSLGWIPDRFSPSGYKAMLKSEVC